MSRTFADLIRTVSINVGDLYEGTLTGATSATAPADSGRTEGDGWWTGGELALVTAASASNVGAAEPITNWTQAGGVFTTNAFPATPAAGDKYQIRRRPKHTLSAVQEFINQAVREVERQNWVPIDSYLDEGSTQIYLYGHWEYPVPADMEMIHKVMYQATDDAWAGGTDSQGNVITAPWVELDQTKWSVGSEGTVLIQPLDDYWDWDRSNIIIPDQAPLRFVGSKRPTPFVNLTDPNPYEGNYLEVYATARLCLRLAEGAQDETDFMQKFKTWYGLEADAFRGTRRGLPTGSRKVRRFTP